MDARRAAVPVVPATPLPMVVVPQGAEPDSNRDGDARGVAGGTRKIRVGRTDGYGKHLPLAASTADDAGSQNDEEHQMGSDRALVRMGRRPKVGKGGRDDPDQRRRRRQGPSESRGCLRGFGVRRGGGSVGRVSAFFGGRDGAHSSDAVLKLLYHPSAKLHCTKRGSVSACTCK
jgi:hypothetical protein